MFCPNCGKQIPDNAAFCAECGKAISSASAPVAAPTAPVSKIQYFTKVAPQPNRIRAFIALGLGILCILFVFLSANNAVNGSMLKIPVISLVLDDADEMQDELDEAVSDLKKFDTAELEEFLHEFLGVSVDSDEIEAKKNKILNLFSPFSLNSVIKLTEMFGAGDDEISEIVEVFNVVITVVWVYAVILMVLTALGVLFQKTWLMVLAYVLGVAFVAMTGGVVLVILATVAYIATAVLFSKMKGEYNAYKANCAIGR